MTKNQALFFCFVKKKIASSLNKQANISEVEQCIFLHSLLLLNNVKEIIY